ncbi:MAG: ABC transporter permease [Acetobacteraceae bacterium]|nr:ABC transporter permease [Acetobacteraceae bacterium]
MTSRWLLRRLLGMVPTLLLTWTLVFLALHAIPGDPVTLMLGGQPASQEVIEAERHRLGLDRPVGEQYVGFLGRAVVADFGESFRTRQKVATMIAEQAPYTVSLAFGGLLVGVVLGVSLGLLAGMRPEGWVDAAVMTTALAGLSLPSFWIGMLLIQVFATSLGWVPVLGTGPVALILPSITVGLYLAGSLARLVRASIIEAAGQDYVRTARAKGLPPVRVVLRHIGRNAVIPPLTLLGTQFALLIGGAVVTERVFARPGLGAMLVDAVLTKDYPLVQGLVVVLTAAYIVINLGIDLLYGVIDPRIARA